MDTSSLSRKRLGDQYSEFWASAARGAAFVAICLAALVLITIEVQCGQQPPSPAAEEFLFD
jgi:hypothetical protein